MYRIYCNSCYSIFNREKLYSLTSCGHVYCSDCLPRGVRESHCKVCKRKFSKMPINRSMPESTWMLFKDVRKTMISYQKVVRFQAEQNENFIQHLHKENERLHRLVGCLKKRVEFLMKKSDASVASEMYTTIKQEPIDDDYLSANGINREQLENIDWTDDFSMENGSYESKTRQYVNNENLVPQMKNFPEQSESAFANGMRRVVSGASINSSNQTPRKKITFAQDQPNGDKLKWNPQMYAPKLSVKVEKASDSQPVRQTTIDQYLSRGNFMNSIVSKHFPSESHSFDSNGLGNYPSNVLATRPIDASTIKRHFNGI